MNCPFKRLFVFITLFTALIIFKTSYKNMSMRNSLLIYLHFSDFIRVQNLHLGTRKRDVDVVVCCLELILKLHNSGSNFDFVLLFHILANFLAIGDF